MSSSVAVDTKSPVEATEAPEGRGGVQAGLTNSRAQLFMWRCKMGLTEERELP